MRSASSQPLLGQLSKRFQVSRVLGVGGMGIVLAAYDNALGRDVAVKLVRCGHGAQARAKRLVREAETVAKLHSPHVAAILDLGWLDAESPFIVMELLQGRDLAAVLRDEGPLSVARACRLILQACEALSEAHDAGIVHRDLKPSNLFLVERPHEPESIRVLDFGLAKELGVESASTQLTQQRAFPGTPRYMAPEQLRAQKADQRIDVWGIGLTLYELLSGQLPFEGRTTAEVLQNILGLPPRPLRPAVALPGELETLLLRCLEKTPGARPRDLRVFSRELRELLVCGALPEASPLVPSGTRPRTALASRSSSTRPLLGETDQPSSEIRGRAGAHPERAPRLRGLVLVGALVASGGAIGALIADRYGLREPAVLRKLSVRPPRIEIVPRDPSPPPARAEPLRRARPAFAPTRATRAPGASRPGSSRAPVTTEVPALRAAEIEPLPATLASELLDPLEQAISTRE